MSYLASNTIRINRREGEGLPKDVFRASVAAAGILTGAGGSGPRAVVFDLIEYQGTGVAWDKVSGVLTLARGVYQVVAKVHIDSPGLAPGVCQLNIAQVFPASNNVAHTEFDGGAALANVLQTSAVLQVTGATSYRIESAYVASDAATKFLGADAQDTYIHVVKIGEF